MDAILYPLGRLHDENNLIVERENGKIITEAQLAQHGVSGILSKKARSAFSKMTKQLNMVAKPILRLLE